MRKIHPSEFIPPIVHRAIKYFRKKTGRAKHRLPPFNYVPNGMDVRWVLDVGANVGDVADAALQNYPHSKVICFEPVSQTFEILQKRLAKYSDRAHLHKSALSDKSGQDEINITTFHGANSIEPQARFHQKLNPHVRELHKEKIELVMLDDVAINFPTQKIDILKIDVEGHEIAVLRGGLKFIAGSVDVIIIEVSLMRDSSWEDQALFEIFSLLQKAGFRLVNIMDLHRAKGDELMLAQMDCVFRHKRNL
jgi:FkbM family methyltransferase